MWRFHDQLAFVGIRSAKVMANAFRAGFVRREALLFGLRIGFRRLSRRGDHIKNARPTDALEQGPRAAITPASALSSEPGTEVGRPAEAPRRARKDTLVFALATLLTWIHTIDEIRIGEFIAVPFAVAQAQMAQA